jgi:hypothetical protein
LQASANWEKAASLLEEIARNEYKTALAAKEQLDSDSDDIDMLAGYRDPRVLTEMQEGQIVLHLQFVSPAGQVTNMTDRIWRSFLKSAAADPSIKFAEP